jgi:hypothetical protein
MNSVFALMIITSAGVVEAPNTFKTLADCQAVVQRVQRETYCVEKKPADTQKELNTFLALFKQMRTEMENDFNKDTKQKAP